MKGVNGLIAIILLLGGVLVIVWGVNLSPAIDTLFQDNAVVTRTDAFNFSKDFIVTNGNDGNQANIQVNITAINASIGSPASPTIQVNQSNQSLNTSDDVMFNLLNLTSDLEFKNHTSHILIKNHTGLGNAGGDLIVTAGNGGKSPGFSASGVGGDLLLSAGRGGIVDWSPYFAGVGGLTNVSGGRGGDSEATGDGGLGGVGGVLDLHGGYGGIGTGVFPYGNGGNVLLRGGDGGTLGGNIYAYGGDGTTDGSVILGQVQANNRQTNVCVGSTVSCDDPFVVRATGVHDPIADFDSTSSTSLRVRVGGTYSNNMFISWATNGFITGTKLGDAGVAFGDGNYVLGRRSKRAIMALNYTSMSVGVNLTNPATTLHVFSNQDTSILTLEDADGRCSHNPESSSETITCTSDIRQKSDIRDTGNKTEDILKYRIRDYTYNKTLIHIEYNETTNTTIQYNDTIQVNATGIIAQELQDKLPDFVRSRSDGLLAVDMPNIWVLVKVLQEQEEKIKDLEKRILALERSIG